MLIFLRWCPPGRPRKKGFWGSLCSFSHSFSKRQVFVATLFWKLEVSKMGISELKIEQFPANFRFLRLNNWGRALSLAAAAHFPVIQSHFPLEMRRHLVREDGYCGHTSCAVGSEPSESLPSDAAGCSVPAADTICSLVNNVMASQVHVVGQG